MVATVRKEAVRPAAQSASHPSKLVAIMGPSGSVQMRSEPRVNIRTMNNLTVMMDGLSSGKQLPVMPQLASAVWSGAKRPAVGRSKREIPVKQVEKISRHTLVGAAMQLSARVFAAVGLVIQRAAAIDPERVVLRRVGIACYLATALPDALSYLMAPQALLTTLFGIEPLIVSVLIALLLPYDAVLITGQHSIATFLCILGSLGYILCLSGFAVPMSVGAEEHEATVAWFDNGGHLRAMILVLLIMLPVAFSIVDLSKHEGPVLSSRSRGLLLPAAAAVSLSLQRLLLRVLGIFLNSIHWQFLKVCGSPAILGCVALSLLSTASCCYIVILSVQEVLPHIFVPLYTTMSVLLQFVQSAVILREFRDEAVTDRLLLPVQALCIAVTLLGIGKLHMAQHSRKQFVSTWGRPQTSNDFKCLAPVPLSQTLAC